MNTPFDIVLMVGIPGSGKTTFYRERLFPSHLYISLDQLRTRSAEAELFAFALKRHKPCVIDNTNVTAAERRRYIQLARKEMDARIVVYCFVPDLEGCLVRTGNEGGGRASRKSPSSANWRSSSRLTSARALTRSTT